MKVIIAGSRGIKDYQFLKDTIKKAGFEIDEIVSGGAKGVDTLGEQYSMENSIPCKIYPAAWKIYGKAAGMIRNRKMVEYGKALIAIWDGKSKGTENIIKLAKEQGKKVYIARYDKYLKEKEETEKELEHFKKTGIPRCQQCKKDFKKVEEQSSELHSTWEPDCKCSKKKLRLSIG
jgi:predicted Rossmann fold nucleotide-binding protein DprA/Smf involved in DNA uptake